mmetsp:Transcript_6875/g.26566  ORF Transcript_6875/g.26566 Transcript_6875/m.26566 type:complete len:97 (+) Transcript_6875:68-358(+)
MRPVRLCYAVALCALWSRAHAEADAAIQALGQQHMAPPTHVQPLEPKSEVLQQLIQSMASLRAHELALSIAIGVYAGVFPCLGACAFDVTAVRSST